MKIKANESDESPVKTFTPPKWVQLKPLAIEALLLMALFIVLGMFCLELSVSQLWLAGCKNVPLLVAFMAIFGAYRKIEATNAVKLFKDYLLSILVAGSVFLMYLTWLTVPLLDYRYVAFFLIVAFFMLHSVRPLIFNCSDR